MDLCIWEDVVHGRINWALSALIYEVKIQKINAGGITVSTMSSSKSTIN